MQCSEIRKQYNGICKSVEVDNSNLFGRCNCPNVKTPVCGNDGRSYLNKCYAKCLGGGVKHLRKCSQVQPKAGCRCKSGNQIVCGADFKNYTPCTANCHGIQILNQHSCGLLGEHRSAESITNADFE